MGYFDKARDFFQHMFLLTLSVPLLVLAKINGFVQIRTKSVQEVLRQPWVHAMTTPNIQTFTKHTNFLLNSFLRLRELFNGFPVENPKCKPTFTNTILSIDEQKNVVKWEITTKLSNKTLHDRKNQSKIKNK